MYAHILCFVYNFLYFVFQNHNASGSDAAPASPVLCAGEFFKVSSNQLCFHRSVQVRIQSCVSPYGCSITNFRYCNNDDIMKIRAEVVRELSQCLSGGMSIENWSFKEISSFIDYVSRY